MVDSVDQIVRRYRQASAKLRREHNTPAKARAFLVKAGILERHRESANGVRLAKRFRSP
jgi:hypothetical protein